MSCNALGLKGVGRLSNTSAGCQKIQNEKLTFERKSVPVGD